jgi:uncharacterized RDD family membrane protein YckC
MKCPKCHYLGFETGDRCKNCGYDFSLVPLDLDLNRRDAASEPSARVDEALPLFAPSGADDDLPLVKLPVAPRPPLAVRRTPDTPRVRNVPKAPRAPSEPVLQFVDDHPAMRVGRPIELKPSESPSSASPSSASSSKPSVTAVSTSGASVGPSGAGRRLMAAALDLAILLAIDAVVVYFTLRLAALSPSEWTMLPPVPLAAFLVLLKLGYFSAFTAVGGQTIGKMATGIRVVGEDNRALDPTSALRRTLAGVLSCITLGVGFLPALFSDDRRALHDRLAHTRVVTLPS